MFKTTIFLKGKERTLQFSTWVIGEIESALKGDTATIKMFAYMLFFGLIHGEGLRSKYIAEEKIDFDVLDCYDWIDEQGDFKVMKCRGFKIYISSQGQPTCRVMKKKTRKPQHRKSRSRSKV